MKSLLANILAWFKSTPKYDWYKIYYHPHKYNGVYFLMGWHHTEMRLKLIAQSAQPSIAASWHTTYAVEGDFDLDDIMTNPVSNAELVFNL